MQNWTDTEGCSEGVHCGTCRDRGEAGRKWRASLAAHFALPGREVDFDCPHGKPWDYRPDPAPGAQRGPVRVSEGQPLPACDYRKPSGYKSPCCTFYKCKLRGQRVSEKVCRHCGRMADPAEFKGQIVVLLPVRNEGPRAHASIPEVVMTIRDLRKQKAPGTDLRFAVVDDCSEDGCCSTLATAKDVTLWRSHRPQGQGIARNLGVLAFPDARGYVSLDAHMRMETQYGLERLVLDAEATGGIVGCMSHNLAKRDGKRGGIMQGAGSKWHTSTKGGIMNFNSNWCYARHLAKEPPLKEVALLSGQCYVFTRKWYDQVGGFNETLGLYGFFERDLCINCYFQKLPVLVNPRVQSWHWYRKDRPYEMTNIWRWYGYVQCLRSMFRPDVWESTFLPKVEGAQKRLNDPVLGFLLRDPHIDVLQAAFERKKKRTDEEVLEWMGMSQ